MNNFINGPNHTRSPGKNIAHDLTLGEIDNGSIRSAAGQHVTS